MSVDYPSMRGWIVAVLKDVSIKNGREWTAWEGPNTITLVARSGWVGWLTGSSWTPPNWIGIGTGTASATSVSASGLQFELARHSAVVRENLNLYTAKYVTNYGTTIGNGTLREFGLFNATAGGAYSMFAIAAVNIVKASSNSMSVTWYLATLSGSAI